MRVLETWTCTESPCRKRWEAKRTCTQGGWKGTSCQAVAMSTTVTLSIRDFHTTLRNWTVWIWTSRFWAVSQCHCLTLTMIRTWVRKLLEMIAVKSNHNAPFIIPDIPLQLKHEKDWWLRLWWGKVNQVAQRSRAIIHTIFMEENSDQKIGD